MLDRHRDRRRKAGSGPSQGHGRMLLVVVPRTEGNPWLYWRTAQREYTLPAQALVEFDAGRRCSRSS